MQILYPLGVRILKEYEQYNPVARSEVHTRPISELLDGYDAPSDAVRRYFATGVRQVLPEKEDFDLLGVPLTVDLYRIHCFFLEDEFEICKTVQALCEIVYLYNCDVLLLSGRPSLPARHSGPLSNPPGAPAGPDHRAPRVSRGNLVSVP